tara:strand:- start:1908 stop:3506 length:1599 start_codon:yes stop_codon:yes gene_type:complete
LRVIGAKTVDGSVTATASGTIVNNKPVILNANGTVSAISGTINTTQVINTLTDPFGSNPSGDIKSVCFSPDTNQIVVATCVSSASNEGRVLVGTVDPSNNAVTWGSNYTVFSSTADSKTKIHCMYNEVLDHVEILWRENSTTKLVKGTLSGTGTAASVANVTSPYQLEGNSPDHITASIDQSTGVGLLMWYDGGNQESRIKAWRWNGSAFVNSGQNVVPYSHQGGTGAEARYPSSVYCANTAGSNPLIVFTYADDDNGQKGVLLGCSTAWNGSAASVTVGTARSFLGQVTEWHSVSYSPSRNRIINVVASSGINSGQGGMMVYEFTPPTSGANALNGNYFSQYGSQNILHGVYSSTFPVSVYDEESNKNIVVYCDPLDGGKTKMLIGTREFTASGTQYAYASRYDLSVVTGNQGQAFCFVYDSNAERSVLLYSDTTSARMKGFIIRPEFGETTNATIKGCIGFADGGYSNGQTVTVKVANSIIGGQSLTPGKFYYVREDGTLSTVSGNPVIEAGIAVSTTELLITSNEERIN